MNAITVPMTAREELVLQRNQLLAERDVTIDRLTEARNAAENFAREEQRLRNEIYKLSRLIAEAEREGC